MRQKFKAMTLFEFLDKYPLPTNLKEVEEQFSGRTFRFLHSLNPDTLQKKFRTHWTTQTSSGIYQTSKRNTRNSSTSEATTETSITDTVLAL